MVLVAVGPFDPVNYPVYSSPCLARGSHTQVVEKDEVPRVASMGIFCKAQSSLDAKASATSEHDVSSSCPAAQFGVDVDTLRPVLPDEEL